MKNADCRNWKANVPVSEKTSKFSRETSHNSPSRQEGTHSGHSG